MACIALILVGALVLIVLTALGVISTSADS
jgi:hypothetical protein